MEAGLGFQSGPTFLQTKERRLVLADQENQTWWYVSIYDTSIQKAEAGEEKI